MDIEKEYKEKLGASERYLLSQIDLLNSALEVTGREKGSRNQELTTLLVQVMSFSSSVVSLARGGKISEMYLLSRSILETSINYSYMLTCDAEEFDRFLEFSKRNIGRSIETRAKAFEAIGVSLSIPNLRKIAPFAEVFEKFISPKKGVDLTKWETPKSFGMSKKLEVIAANVDGFNSQLFDAASFFIYEDASEIAHGTLYGSALCTGAFFGAKDYPSAVRYTFGIIRTIYLLLGAIVDSLILVTHSKKPLDKLLMASKANFAVLGKSLEQ
jgi:hypothetical protein